MKRQFEQIRYFTVVFASLFTSCFIMPEWTIYTYQWATDAQKARHVFNRFTITDNGIIALILLGMLIWFYRYLTRKIKVSESQETTLILVN